MPGGRLLLGETLKEGVARIVKKKTYLDIEVDTASVVVANERVIKDDIVQHAFILLCIAAKPTSEIKGGDAVRWFVQDAIDERQTIASDYYFATSRQPEAGREFIVDDC